MRHHGDTRWRFSTCVRLSPLPVQRVLTRTKAGSAKSCFCSSRRASVVVRRMSVGLRPGFGIVANDRDFSAVIAFLHELTMEDYIPNIVLPGPMCYAPSGGAGES